MHFIFVSGKELDDSNDLVLLPGKDIFRSEFLLEY